MREDDLWAALAAWHDPTSAAAREDGWWAEKSGMDVGDIGFSLADDELVLLERKTAEDLGASQRDGRYREQRARLLAKKGRGTAVGYVVEAAMPWSPTLSRSWCRGAFRETHLQAAIVRLQMRYGLVVFQASDLKETVMWIRRIAAALVADPATFRTGVAATEAGAAAAYTAAIHVKKAANMDTDRVLTSLLLTLPGVGAAAAEAIVKATAGGGFPAFHAMSEEAIAACPMGAEGKSKGVRKVGKALAAKIWRIFHGGGMLPPAPLLVTSGLNETSQEL